MFGVGGRGNHLGSSLQFAIVLWSLRKVIENFFPFCDGIRKNNFLN